VRNDDLATAQEAHWKSILAEIGMGDPVRDGSGSPPKTSSAPARMPQANGRVVRGAWLRDLQFSWLCLACHGEGWVRAGRGDVGGQDSARDSGSGLVREGARDVRRSLVPASERNGVSGMVCCRCPSGRARARRWRQAAEADEAQARRVQSSRHQRRDLLRQVQPAEPSGSSWRPAVQAQPAESLGQILGRLT
jgi:hypothetical protein